jgi:hypothetical protein
LFAASTDGGKTWQQAEKDGQYKLYVHGLGFGGDTFVAVGGDPGTVGVSSPFAMTSTDGLAWGEYLNMNPKVPILRRLAYGKGKDGAMTFVGVGDRGRRASSADGKTWAEVQGTKAVDTLIDVAFGEPKGAGMFMGVGLHGLRIASLDGVNWLPRVTGEEGEHLNSILWTGEQFVAVGMGATYSSKDGYYWDRKPNKDAPLAVAYGNGVYVGTNWKGRILTSKDAVEWTQVHKCEQHLEAVAFGMID